LELRKISFLILDRRKKNMAAKVDNEKCTGCAACVDACPVNAIKIENGKAIISEECVDCGACISQCPVDAIIL